MILDFPGEQAGANRSNIPRYSCGLAGCANIARTRAAAAGRT